jgi:hypothetical protein
VEWPVSDEKTATRNKSTVTKDYIRKARLVFRLSCLQNLVKSSMKYFDISPLLSTEEKRNITVKGFVPFFITPISHSSQLLPYFGSTENLENIFF